MKDSLKKNLTKTQYYQKVTGTEDDYIFDNKIYSIIKLLIFLRGLKSGFCSKTELYEWLLDKILYKNMFLSPCNCDIGWFHQGFFSIDNQLTFLKEVWNEVSAVKQNHRKDSLKKYFTTTYFNHFVTGTEDGSMREMIVSTSFKATYFLGGWNDVSGHKNRN